MQQQGNPFGAPSYPPASPSNPYYQQQQPPPPQQQQAPTMGGNPFDPMAGQVQAAPPPTQPSPYDSKPPSDNPFGGAAMSPPPPQQQQQPPQGYAPYGAPPPGQPSNALVPAQTQSNPYALPGNGGSGNPFDPFAPPPPMAPPQPPAPYPGGPPSYATDPYGGETSSQMTPYGQTPAPPPDPYHQPPPEPYSQPPPPQQPQQQAPPPNNYQSYDHAGPPAPRLQTQAPPRGDADMYDMDSPGSVETSQSRNRYSQELAHNAPPGASPLPKADLVRKKGFVLSRISFRTIVMKKWKQAYWVQYGPHTMLWFRSQSDFDDWMNNPYHNQLQRNFLIKLAVNFVHDLYKPSVRGYQVTQCRTKAYGNKMVRQFKLERWMDYGPTIAAAFGSYNPKEVDDLREALVDCMRNTPLSGGIRATGAVRQGLPDQPSQSQPFQYGSRPSNGEGRPPAPAENGSGPPGPSNDSVAEETDLLDLDNWDDVPAPGAPPQGSPYQQGPPGGAPYQQGPSPGASPYQQGPPPGSPYQQGPPQQQSPYQQGPPAGYPGGYPAQPQQPPQQLNYAGAMVPAPGGGSSPYPGAPAYPGAPPPAYGGAQGWQGQPSPQQQQQPYGQQAYPPQGF